MKTGSSGQMYEGRQDLQDGYTKTGSSGQTSKAGSWHDIFQVLKKTTAHPIYTSKVTSHSVRERTFHDRNRLKAFTKAALQKTPEGIL